jgi:3-hydroxyisobutyrate dehydrogenase-like beta-hydroxyacid dehydrogenase
MTTIGLLHPGEMGAALGASMRTAGHDVVWSGDGRSAPTRRRADAIGARDLGTIAGVCSGADVVVAVCPPDAALTVAEEVADHGFSGTYVDANAIAPATARTVEAVVGRAGASYVDGGIIGGPAAPRLSLSGDGAADIAVLFAPPVDAVVLAGDPFAASALKMLYAGWTKGTTALLLALAAAADHLGVGEALAAEWRRSQPGLAERLSASAGAAGKAWRWQGEMLEIGHTLDDAGQPAGFHEAAAEVFGRMAGLKDADGADIGTVLATLLGR